MNETGFFSIPNMIYWLIVILTVCITTPTLGQIWKRQENHRWTAGYFILFFWGFFMVLFDHWDANTYLALFFGTGFAGIIKVGYEQLRNSIAAERIRTGFDELVKAVAERFTGGGGDGTQSGR